MLIFYILVFIVSSLLLAFSGSLVVDSLVGVARHLKWREFVVGFVIMSLATSMPNFFVGLTSALRGIPELSFGDVIGGNVVDLTLVIALATLFAGGISTQSRMVQASSLFTLGIAVLPLLLSWDGNLNRADGLVLIGAFFAYAFWLFSSEERFRKAWRGREKKNGFTKNLLLLTVGLILLVLGSQGVVSSALFFAENFGLSLGLIGLLIVGLGNCLPEMYFGVVSAKKGESWLVLGNLMGSVITGATLVLGTVVLIRPIEILDPSPYLLARAFLVVAALFFLLSVKTDRQISKKEAVFLLGIYLVFILSESLFWR
jgi:cation:H+ antiporter